MARLFLGQDGFYPSWAKGEGRWAIQRVFTTVRGMIAETDTLTRPAISNESLLWMPRRVGIRALFSRGTDEAARATSELGEIPLVCGGCGWSGSHPNIKAIGGRGGPTNWRLRCQACGSVVGPDIDSLDTAVIVERWNASGRPRLDPPAAATMIQSSRPVTDLQQWILSHEPLENELAYVAQQLWSNFADFINRCRRQA